MTNSEVFERVANRELSAQAAAVQLLEHDVAERRQRVENARPSWFPAIGWAIATVVIVALLDWFHKRA